MGPTRPSARRPRLCWKALTASSVLSLKTPSMPLLPRSKPSACRRVWRSTTSRPLSPLRSVRTYPTGLPYFLVQTSSRPKRERRATSRGPALRRADSCYPPLTLDYPQDVVCVEDHVVLAVEADLGPGVLGEDDDITLADLDPVLELADGDDLRRLRLLLGRVGKHYPRSRRLLALDDLDERPLSQRLEPHSLTSSSLRTCLQLFYDAPQSGAYPTLRNLCARDCNRECCFSQLQAELSRKLVLRQGSNRLLGDLPLLEAGDGRDARDAVVHRSRRIVVHVDLDERHVLARLGHLLEDRGDAPARHAPRRPEIYYNRPLRPQNVALESRVRYFGYCHSLEPPYSLEVIFAEHSSTRLAASKVLFGRSIVRYKRLQAPGLTFHSGSVGTDRAGAVVRGSSP